MYPKSRSSLPLTGKTKRQRVLRCSVASNVNNHRVAASDFDFRFGPDGNSGALYCDPTLWDVGVKSVGNDDISAPFTTTFFFPPPHTICTTSITTYVRIELSGARRAFAYVACHSFVALKPGQTDWAVAGSLALCEFVGSVSSPRVVRIVDAGRPTDSSIRLLLLKLGWTFTVFLVLVLVCDEVGHRNSSRARLWDNFFFSQQSILRILATVMTVKLRCGKAMHRIRCVN